MMDDVNRVRIEGLGAQYLAQLRQELEAEGFEVEAPLPMETRSMPPWADSPLEILAVVTLGERGTALTAKAIRAIKAWKARRQDGTPPRRSKLLGPDGEPIVIDDHE